MEFQYLEAATDNSGSDGSDGEAGSPRSGGGGESDAQPAPAAATGSETSGAAGALRGWRAWGGGALSALSGLQLDSVQRLASEALATVRRDVGEFSVALTADAAELAAVSAGAVDEALPELRATAAGLQEKLEVVGGGIETAGATLLANIAQARAPAATQPRRFCAAAAAAPHRAAARHSDPRATPRRARRSFPHADADCAPAVLRPAAQVRDAIIAENDANVRGRRGRGGREAGGQARPAAAPSMDKLVAAMQRDSATYCDEPADTAAFAAFKAGFSLEARGGGTPHASHSYFSAALRRVCAFAACSRPRCVCFACFAAQGRAPEVAEVLRKNAFMAELHSRIVPLVRNE